MPSTKAVSGMSECLKIGGEGTSSDVVGIICRDVGMSENLGKGGGANSNVVGIICSPWLRWLR